MVVISLSNRNEKWTDYSMLAAILPRCFSNHNRVSLQFIGIEWGQTARSILSHSYAEYLSVCANLKHVCLIVSRRVPS